MANINAEASRIWEALTTPLYDELISRNKGNRERYLVYVKKLQEKYPGCRLRYPVSASVSGIGSGSEQPWNAAHGSNHYVDFLETEKRCQLNNSYKDLNIGTGHGTYMYGFEALKEALKRKAVEEKQAANMAKRIQEAQNKAERNRLSKIPIGNLLGLNNKNEPNMLKFEPTKNGLNNRSKELNGLFRKSRRNRKSRKTRKGRK
jgi:hypothetical protein